MTYRELDFAFPFFVFAYGTIMLFIFTNPKLIKLAEERLPSDVWYRFQSKKLLAVICFVVGGLWSLQNLWLRP